MLRHGAGAVKGVFQGLHNLTKLDLTGLGLTVVHLGFFDGLNQLQTLVMAENPSECSVNTSKFTCECARDAFVLNQKLPGGSNGNCLCPAGQFAIQSVCMVILSATIHMPPYLPLSLSPTLALALKLHCHCHQHWRWL